MGAYKTESELLAAGRVIMRMNIPMWKGSSDQQCNSLNDCTGLTMVSSVSSDLIKAPFAFVYGVIPPTPKLS